MKLEKSMNFLTKLKKNNNKEWFDKNKSLYLEAKDEFENFVQNIINSVIKFDKEIEPKLLAKDCIFRIYKDVRFSKDKTPYKTNFGAHLTPGGKKSSSAGYYFHLEPGNSFIAGGSHQPLPEQLQAIRQEIDYNGKNLMKILNTPSFKKLFKGFDESEKLKTIPKGFEKEHEYGELLKLKSFMVLNKIDEKKILLDAKNTFLINSFKEMLPLNTYLRKAIEK